jgi:acyl dehydratase
LLSSFKRPIGVQRLPPVAWQCEAVVLASHLQAYQQLCGFDAGSLAPLTYPQVLTTPLVMAYVTSVHCPWPAMGTVHLANAITQHHPVQAGDALTIQLQTGELWAHPKGQVYSLNLSILRQRDGLCVWQATQTLLRVGASHPQGQPWLEAAPSAELQPSAQWEAAADVGRRYARISQDHNPIHLSALSARALGQRSAIAHGLWTQARALACLRSDGVPHVASLTAQFKRPLRLPGRATLWAERSPHTTDSAQPVTRVSHFEVRDVSGQEVHLRAVLQADSLPPASRP